MYTCVIVQICIGLLKGTVSPESIIKSVFGKICRPIFNGIFLPEIDLYRAYSPSVPPPLGGKPAHAEM